MKNITVMLEGVDAGNPESTAISMQMVADFKEESEGGRSGSPWCLDWLETVYWITRG